MVERERESTYFMALYVRNATLLVLLLLILSRTTGISEVVFAVNAGGNAHMDTFGIMYEDDPLEGKIGTASDFGRQLLIRNVPLWDQVLYQTERFHHSTFGYDIPLRGDGDYVLVLKFCEVYFDAPGQKIFDVVLNGELKVIQDLDIFRRVGRGVSLDERIPFTVSDDSVLAGGGKSLVKGDAMRVEFVKGLQDNPKVNALFVVKVDVDDFINLFLPGKAITVSDLGELKSVIENLYLNKKLENNKEWLLAGKLKAKKNRQQPKHENEYDVKGLPKGKQQPSGRGSKNIDPYAEDTSYMIPIFIGMGAAIPILFRLCKI